MENGNHGLNYNTIIKFFFFFFIVVHAMMPSWLKSLIYYIIPIVQYFYRSGGAIKINTIHKHNVDEIFYRRSTSWCEIFNNCGINGLCTVVIFRSQARLKIVPQNKICDSIIYCRARGYHLSVLTFFFLVLTSLLKGREGVKSTTYQILINSSILRNSAIL